MKTILVIREFENFSRILAENGFKIVNLPMIETKPLEDLSGFEAKLKRLKDYDGIFLTSKNAAQVLADKLRKKNIIFSGKVYILGGRSFEILRDGNLNLIYDESANTAREMLENITPKNLQNKNFLFIRGEKSLRIVPEFLSKAANVDEIVVYETRDVKIESGKISDLRGKFADKEITATCFFSPSGAESFLKQFGAEILHQTIIATIGKTTTDYFERQNLNADFVSSKSNAENFAFGLVKYLKEGLPTKHTKGTKKEK